MWSRLCRWFVISKREVSSQELLNAWHSGIGWESAFRVRINYSSFGIAGLLIFIKLSLCCSLYHIFSIHDYPPPPCVCPMADVFMDCASTILDGCSSEELDAAQDGMANRWKDLQIIFVETCVYNMTVTSTVGPYLKWDLWVQRLRWPQLDLTPGLNGHPFYSSAIIIFNIKHPWQQT